MALSALECPDGVCHSHHGGHAVAREEVERNLSAHGSDWCERLAERIYEISIDSFCQTVMPDLHQQGWQRRHLDWEFKLAAEPAEVERTVVDGTINAMESFLRSSEVQRLFVKELVQGTIAEASDNSLRGKGIRYLIEEELMTFLAENRDDLLDRMAQRLLEDAGGDFARAHRAASDDLTEVQHLLLNHAEAVG
ncbi:MAG: EF-1 guanine nucleotide exchange domain-containing protein [Cyanobacteria bacterium]|nr:EF-1 guanine nucleotide exchange domain-containing protein [Cyanobacteriota bacterium]